MPSQQAVSALMSKLGPRINKGLAANAAKAITWGPDRLPPGIVNGVCQVDKVEILKGEANSKNPGQFYCRMTAVIMEPEFIEHEGQRVRVRGRQTSHIEQLADTKGDKGTVTVEEHADRLANTFRACMYAQTGGTFDASQLEEAAQTVEEAAPFIHFSTRLSKEVIGPDGKVKYEARVWEESHGSRNLEADYQPPEPEDGGVKDEGKGPSPSANGAATKPPGKGGAGPVSRAAAAAPKAPAKAKPAPAPEPELDEPGSDFQLMEIVEAAKSEDKTDARQEARNELERLAVAAEYTEDEVNEAPDWDAVADMINSPKAEGGDDPAADDEPPAGEEPVEAWEPAKSAPCSYQRLDAKGAAMRGKDKKVLKPAACVVVSINAKTETAVLRLLEDNKTLFKDVPLADVLPPE